MVWPPKWELRVPPSVLGERSAGRGELPKVEGQVLLGAVGKALCVVEVGEATVAQQVR